MSKKLTDILAENIGNLFAPNGRFSSNGDAEKKTGVKRSTFDRLRNANKQGTPVVGVDKLEAIAKSLNLEPWQLIYPDLNIENPPSVKELKISQKQIELIKNFEQLGKEEQEYILKKIYSLLDDKSFTSKAESA